VVKVQGRGRGEFLVSIEEGGSRTEHLVRVDDEYCRYLTENQMSKEELVKVSFAFLLQREPAESILPEFDLRVINRYYPDYEREIRHMRG